MKTKDLFHLTITYPDGEVEERIASRAETGMAVVDPEYDGCEIDIRGVTEAEAQQFRDQIGGKLA